VNRSLVAALTAIILALAAASPCQADKTGQGASPQPKAILDFPPGASTVHIPVRIVNDTVVVRVRVADRDMDFSFDSGSGATYINADVFKSMGLDTHAGAVPMSLSIGDLTIRNAPVFSNPIYQHTDQDVAIVGLIGGDLLRNAVVRLDYEARTLDITKPGSFTPPPGVPAIPVRGRSVPVVTANIGDVMSDEFIVDTGAWAVMVFHQFAAAHPELFTKTAAYLGSEVLSQPICGLIVNSAYNVSTLSIATAPAVADWKVLLVPQSSCFDLKIDGLIGYDYLRLFTVTFDLPDSRLYLELSKRYAPASGN